MSSDRYDLHVHSNVSDGTLSPRELIALAVDRGLSGIALTDHDTVDGVAEARAQAAMLGIECIAGVELSCNLAEGKSVHLLGYFVDPQHAGLQEVLRSSALQRLARATVMCEQLTAAGLAVSLDDVLLESGGLPPGRPHVARAMVRLGHIAIEHEAFTAGWLTPGGAGYVHFPGVSIGTAIATLHAAGGIAVFAHPGARTAQGVREAAIREAHALGLDGIEVDHPDHTDDAVRRCVELAVELQILQTSGSDDHGRGGDGNRLGCRTVPVRTIERMRERAASYVA